MHSKTAYLFFILSTWTASSFAQTADDVPLQLLPSSVSAGSDVHALINDGPAFATVQVSLVTAGALLPLRTLALDGEGRGVVKAPLPAAINAGSYTVRVSTTSTPAPQVVDEDPLTVTAGPSLSLNPESGVPGELVSFTANGLVPGTVEVRFDDQLVYGPLAVSGDTLSATFQVPAGTNSVYPVVLDNRVGTRLVGVGFEDFRRLTPRTQQVQVTGVAMPERLARDESFEISGQIAVPDGSATADYHWTLVWTTAKGDRYPVNIGEVDFDPAGKTQTKGSGVAFSVQATVPSISRGFPAVAISQLDELGFVYTNPDTGDSGYVLVAAGTGGLDDYEGITINGRLTDNLGQPLGGAIWTIEAKTQLIDPDSVNDGAVTKAAGSAIKNSAAALAHGNNQITQTAQQLDALSPYGCPLSLANGFTNENGEYSFAFSPEATDFLNAINKNVVATAGGNIEVYPPDVEAQNEFLVRLSGLTLGYGIPVDDGNPQTSLYGGLFYEFRRFEGGTYRFRENLQGAFDQPFNPANTVLTSVMPQIPAGTILALPATPYIVGLANSDRGTLTNGQDGVRMSRLFSFPSRAGTALDLNTIELRLPWSPANGILDATVRLNGQVVGVLAAANDTLCNVEGVEYSLEIPGLATIAIPAGQDALVIPGEINAGTDTGLTFTGHFEIFIERAPQWWRDTSSFDDAFITWSASEVKIRANEKPKANDASADGVPKDVGDLDNNNGETATVFQTLYSGLINQPFRVSATETTVANQPGDSVANKLYAGRSGVHSWSVLLDGFLKNQTVEDLRRRGEDDDETLIVGDVITIIDTGKVPLFRYAWGVPPIVSASLGADIWFKALFTYYVFLDFQDFQIDIDALAEPEVSGGIDVFFDLSALFGLVSANVTAAPALGVAMPIVVTNNALDLDATVPCFQFVLDLLASFNIGPCPLCIEYEVDERVLDYAKPEACTVSSLNKLFARRKASNPPPNGTAGLAVDGYGSATAMFPTTQGMQALALNGGVPGQLSTLDTAPGAMRPAAAFFDAGIGLGVWAQSSLTPEQFAAIPGGQFDDPSHCVDENDPASCVSTTPMRIAGTEFQHMVYAVYEAGTWGPTMDLTLPTTGEGGVALAACRGNQAGCPPEGEVLAVWERDTAGDIGQHRLKLDYAIFDGNSRSWSAVQTIDPSSTAKDVQAEPLYVGGEPVVTWIRNPGASATSLDMQTRELWYEFVTSPAGPRRVTGIASALASPSAVAFSGNSFGVAFTRSTDPNFFGNRRALNIARASDCTAGVCTWDDFEPRDQYNRRLFVENPELVLDSLDRLLVVGRQLGVDGDFQTGETIGVVTGAGELFKMELSLADLDQGITQSLSSDGAVNWNTSAVVEPGTGNLLAFNGKGAAVGSLPGAQLKGLAAKTVSSIRPVGSVASKGITGDDTGLFLNMIPRQPDYWLVKASAETSVVSSNEPFLVSVEVQNLGAETKQEVEILATWDGVPGVGSAAGNTFFATPLEGPTTVNFQVRAPRRTENDQPHNLFLTINPSANLPESDSSNNQQVLPFNRLPRPREIAPSVDRAGTIALLDWQQADDERVSGYRIYRRQFGDSEVSSVGYARTNGFVDLNVVPNVTYEYRVVSTSDSLFESSPSPWVTVTIGAATKIQVFQDGFETP